MTTKVLTKQIHRLVKQMAAPKRLPGRNLRSVPDPDTHAALTILQGLWKDRPRTARDLKRVRAKLWKQP